MKTTGKIKADENYKMNVYILRSGSEHWRGCAVVVAKNEQQAKSLVSWDYSEKTEVCQKFIGFTAEPPARVEFQIYGD